MRRLPKNSIPFAFFLILLLSGSFCYADRAAYTNTELTDRLNSTFTDWAERYTSTAADNGVCRLPSSGSDALENFNAFLGIENCLPTERQRVLLWSPDLTETQKNERDTLICRCVQRGTSSESITTPRPSNRDFSVFRRAIYSRQVEARSVHRAQRDFGDAFGPALTTMNFAQNRDEAERIAGVYVTNGSSSRNNRSVEALSNILDPASLNDQMCVPPREFIFTQQFPVEREFYEDLATPFNPDDWNYNKLSEDLKTYGSLANINANYEARRKLSRMTFLIHNPAYKALFASTSAAGRTHARELHTLLQTSLPRPSCVPNGPGMENLNECNRNDPAWKAQLPNYMARMREFLAKPEVNTEILQGNSSVPRLNLENPPFSEILDNPATADINQWRGFCDFRQQETPAPSSNTVRDEIEREYGTDYGNIFEDKNYKRLNMYYCERNRRNRDGRLMMFGDYRRANCQNLSHRFCLANFVSAYPAPDTTESVGGIMWNINEILEKPDIIAETGSTSTGAISAISSSPSSRRESLAAINRSIRSAPETSASLNPQLARTPEKTSTTTPQLQSQTAGFVFPTADGQSAATPQVSPTDSESAPRSSSRSSAEVQRLQAELADLNRDLARENAKPSGERNNSQITDLNARLDSLTRNLEEAQRTNRSLREQIADGEARNARTRTETTTGSGSLDRSPASFQPSSGANVGPQSQADATSLAPAQPGPSGGAANFGSGGSSSGNFAARPQATLSSGNSALLSKYGVQSGSVQGALIVADSSSSIDYQSLRAQSVDSVIPLSLSPEEFNLIARNDQSVLNRYLDQVRAMPGSVVRLDISATGVDGRPLEFFVVKNGNDFSIVPGVNSTPSRTPASLPEGAREFTLSNLRQELGN